MPTYKSERLFLFINSMCILGISLTMLLPMFHLLSVSLSSSQYISLNEVFLLPKGFNLNAYEYIASQNRIWRSMGVSIYITVVGTLVSLLITTTMSYALSRSYMPARSLILKLVLITFIFSIPLIPFFLVVRDFGFLNSLWSLIIPAASGAYYVIIMKTFFQGLSAELFDAGRIDGCNEFVMFARIAVPMSIPVIATIGLFHAVYQWNSYFYAIIFIRDSSLYPIQMLVREIVILENLQSNLSNFGSMNELTLPDQIKSSVILFATLPILIVYPFIQKYFVKGAMLGSIKE
ncbi:carbohydrate ABC transporter permease [Paenibacillus chungangensis]|uniref:Carbohydrate ABC transporter permease n=1 Tax=Paenibacillus chungangensis TaxID=696535 RepID=A0ABW3HUE8_9BACL